MTIYTLGVILSLLVVWTNSQSTTNQWNTHHDEVALTTLFRTIVNNHRDIAAMVQIGTSWRGVPIWCLHLGDNIRVGREQHEPAVKLIGTVHGDEVVGREMLLRFAHELVQNYGNLQTVVGRRATAIIDEIDLYLVPSMNPDGYATNRRGNGHNVDLNRDFPDQFSTTIESTTGRQPETIAVMNFTSLGPQFVLGASLHGGAVVANYPWDGTSNHRNGVYAAAPDDLLFRMIAKQYADDHATMHNSNEFPGGITNGAHWYSLYGGMQDWDYVWHDCIDITLELSETKWPPSTTLETEWNNNREALYSFVEIPTWCGIRGVVQDAYLSAAIPNAIVEIRQVGKPIHVDRLTGEYFRLLAPGEYDIWVSARGYKTSNVKHIVIPQNQQHPLILNVVLFK